MNQSATNTLFDRFNDLHPTLDGSEAVLSGRLEHFPRLRGMATGTEVTLSWGLVHRCIEDGKANLRTN